MIKKLFIILFLLSLNLSLFSQERFRLKWDFKLNQTFTIDKYTKQTIIKDGEVVRKKEIRDYVILLPYKTEKEVTYLKGEYYSYLKNLDTSEPYQLEQSYDLSFGMDKQGKYYVEPQYIMPSIRNIPIFPNKELRMGDTWKGKGIEILEFEPAVTLPVDVFYQLGGKEKKLGKDCVKIVFHYVFNHILDHRNQEIPYKFLGASYSSLWYDFNENLPVYIENLYDLMFIYHNGTYVQYKGDLIGYYNLKRKEEEREKVQTELYDNFKKSEKDFSTEKKEDKVIIDFGDINFEFDSAQLTEEAKGKLKKIGEVLKRYENLSIITKGHTDDIGTEDYNIKLSTERAKSVLSFLLKNNYIQQKDGSYIGVGEKEPKADNSSEEGRQKNRRVEIIIKPE